MSPHAPERDADEGVELPDELSAALAGDDAARGAFDRLPPSHRREYVQWIREAKRDDTRRRRVEKTLAMLRQAGKRGLIRAVEAA